MASKTQETVKLVYTPKPGFVCPGEGWPAADHEESSQRLAAKKIKSGFYRDQFQKEVAVDNRESKANANKKAETQRATAISEADGAATAAKAVAQAVRSEHGRVK